MRANKKIDIGKSPNIWKLSTPTVPRFHSTEAEINVGDSIMHITQSFKADGTPVLLGIWFEMAVNPLQQEVSLYTLKLQPGTIIGNIQLASEYENIIIRNICVDTLIIDGFDNIKNLALTQVVANNITIDRSGVQQLTITDSSANHSMIYVADFEKMTIDNSTFEFVGVSIADTYNYRAHTHFTNSSIGTLKYGFMEDKKSTLKYGFMEDKKSMSLSNTLNLRYTMVNTVNVITHGNTSLSTYDSSIIDHLSSELHKEDITVSYSLDSSRIEQLHWHEGIALDISESGITTYLDEKGNVLETFEWDDFGTYDGVLSYVPKIDLVVAGCWSGGIHNFFKRYGNILNDHLNGDFRATIVNLAATELAVAELEEVYNKMGVVR